MKRKTFYNISLSLPYLALLVSGMFMLSASLTGLGDAMFSRPADGFLMIVLVMLMGSLGLLWAGGIIWVPLYTWMVIVMLFWGRGKSAREVRTLYLLSPLLLACSMGFPAALMYPPGSVVLLSWGLLRLANLDFVLSRFLENTLLEQSLAVGGLWIVMAVTCLVVGYMFVGIALLIEKLMKKRGWFQEEETVRLSVPLSLRL